MGEHKAVAGFNPRPEGGNMLSEKRIKKTLNHLLFISDF